jgi:ABC-type transport system involved in multi-copper enzyme maturation permease subunit
VIFLVVGVVMPLTGFGALRPELEGGRNIELLLLANVSRWQIVLGKWLVMCSLAWLILVSLVPYMLARHFIGGVNIVYSMAFLVGLGMSNAALNGVVIGASGFGNYIGRLVVLGIGAISFTVTTSMCTAMWIASSVMKGGGPPEDSIGTMLISAGFSLVPSVLYCLYGLQIGRSRLRLFEDPTEPPASGLIIAMMLFTPLLVGMFAAPTAGIGGVVAAAVLVVLTLVIDRGPGKKQTVRYAQP